MVHRIALPPQEELKELLRYDPETGKLWWRLPRQGRRMYSQAGTISRDYRVLSIDFTIYYAHRIIWKMLYGTEPLELDHINRDRGDNRIENLRAVSHSTNILNTGPRVWRDLPKGVNVDGKGFSASIRIGGVRQYLGYFPTAKQAGNAYEAKWREHFEELV